MAPLHIVVHFRVFQKNKIEFKCLIYYCALCCITGGKWTPEGQGVQLSVHEWTKRVSFLLFLMRSTMTGICFGRQVLVEFLGMLRSTSVPLIKPFASWDLAQLQHLALTPGTGCTAAPQFSVKRKLFRVLCKSHKRSQSSASKEDLVILTWRPFKTRQVPL